MQGAVPSLADLGEQLDRAGVSLDVVDGEGRLVHINQTFAAKTGFSPDEALGRTPKALLRSDYHSEAFFDELWNNLERGQSWSGRLWSLTKSKAVFVSDTILLPTLRDGRLVRVLSIRTDVTDLQRQEERYRGMVTAALDAVLVSDWDSALFIEVNPAACELFGYREEELHHLTGRKLCAPGQGPRIDSFSAAMKSKGHFKDTLVFKKKDGTEFWADVSAAAFHVAGHAQMVTIIRDVDTRVRSGHALEQSNMALRAAQAKLMHASQLATIGQLAAGVAHEINNPANYVGMSLELMMDKLAELDTLVSDGQAKTLIAEVRRLGEDCIEGNERIAAITRDLRTYGRLEDDEVAIVDIVDVARAAVRMATNEVRHVADLVTELDDVPPVRGGALKLGQVITNLLINAGHAVVERRSSTRGEVKLSVREQDGDVVIVVRDTGVGIPPALRDKVLDPFFTTKPRDRGTGLGLSLCAEIVRQHGGTIEIDSTEGRGTSVEVRLPGVNAHPQPSATSEHATATNGGLRVLIIDDEPVIRHVYECVLSRFHDVVAANGGAAAVELIGRDPAFDVVICDLMMPDVDGLGVYERVRQDAPELAPRMLFLTGGAITERTRSFAASMSDRILHKPVKPNDLVTAVDRMARGG